MDKLSVRPNKIINKKSIQITVFIMYILAMIVFEIGYCNSNNLYKWISGELGANYNFSLCRIVVYAFFLIILYFTRKIFNKEALKSCENKYKRVLIYTYFIVMLAVIAIATIIIIKYPITSRGMSIGIITLLMLGVTLIYISNNALKNIIVINFSLGIVFTFTTEFNNAIDEKKHFMSAFNISFGNFDYAESPITDNQIEELAHLTKFTSIDKFLEEKYNPNITTEVNMDDVPSTPAGNNPILYIFPGIGILIARIIGGSIIDLYIMGRIFNLILFTILSCIAIKLMPYKKNIFTTIFLMPMTILFGAAYSVDGFCIGIISILIAYCLKLKKQDEAISVKQMLILLGIFALTLLAKTMSYVLVAIMFLLLPLKKTLKKYKKQIPIIISVLIIAVLLVVGLILYVTKTKLNADTRAPGTVSVSGQILNLIQNPILGVKVMLLHIKNTLLNFNWYAMLHYSVFFTADAGCVMLPMLIFILYVALTEDDYIFDIKDNIILIISFFAVFLMISMIFYVAFTEVGGTYIGGFQARYIIPILPLVLLTISNKKIQTKNNSNRTMNISLVMTAFIVIGITQLIIV